MEITFQNQGHYYGVTSPSERVFRNVLRGQSLVQVTQVLIHQTHATRGGFVLEHSLAITKKDPPQSGAAILLFVLPTFSFQDICHEELYSNTKPYF